MEWTDVTAACIFVRMEQVLSSLEVCVELAHFSRLGKDWRSASYHDNASRLYWIDAGHGTLEHHGCTFVLGKGRMHLIPARTLFAFNCETFLDQHWVHFTADLAGGLSLFDFVEVTYELKPEHPERVREVFRKIEKLAGKTSPAAELERNGLLLQLVSMFVTTVDTGALARRRRAQIRFKEVLEHIDAHLGEPLRIGELARMAHLDRMYFSRTFHGSMGLSPAQYVMRRRIDRARQRLWTNDEPLRVIAESLGFTDAFHFSKTFRRITGMSPSEFRNARARDRAVGKG